MRQELISIIMPVYNAEKFVYECIESVLSQKYQNFELLIIDDGSRDNTLSICQKFTDNRIVICKQKNSGVSAARNKGLDLARGKYICFIDSDDVISKDYLNILYNLVKDSHIDCGIVKSCSNIRYLNYGSDKINMFNGLENILRELHDGSQFHGQVWGKIFKREIIGKLRFNTNIYINEDMLFVQEYFMKIKNIAVSNKQLYFYRVNSESAINVKYSKKDNSARIAALIMKQEIRHNCPQLIDYANKTLINSDLYIFNKMFVGNNIDHILAKKMQKELRSVSNKNTLSLLQEKDGFKKKSFLLLLLDYRLRLKIHQAKKKCRIK